MYFIKHQDRVSRDVTFRNVTLAGVSKISGQREIEEYATEVSVTTPKVHNNNWSKTLEIVVEYLRTSCGVNDAPLSYVVMKQLLPTAESDNPLNGYNTINEDIIERDTIVVTGTAGTNVALEANRPFTTS